MTHVGPRAEAQTVLEAEEHRIRAALLYNFAKFVTWPESVFTEASTPFSICVLGDDAVIEALREIASSKQVRGRRLVVRSARNTDDLEACQLLFYGSKKIDDLETHRALWAEKHLLTVGETRGFIEAGGIFELSIVDNHFMFAVNLDAARRAGLDISASLLDLAERVIRDQRPGERSDPR